MNEELTKIKEVLGDESWSKIGDTINNINSIYNEKITEIEELKSKNEALNNDKNTLIEANSKLILQQPRIDNDARDYESPKPFNFRELFDENGNFKRR